MTLNTENAKTLGMLFLFLHESDPEAKVKMTEPVFHVCGTTACHAGWFAVANNKSCRESYGFGYAADEMAQFLGFVRHCVLQDWAEENPNIWGNLYGRYIFSSCKAFGVIREPTLEEIGTHWLQVADRAEEIGGE